MKNKAASPIYLFEDSGILVGFTYNDVVPECYIITMDGLESEPFTDEAGISMLRMAMERLSLSARAYNRILKVARTIADLEGCEHVESHHLAEAIGYRTLDRGDWAERGI